MGMHIDDAAFLSSYFDHLLILKAVIILGV